MTQMTPEQEAFNGSRAREVLDNEVFQQAYDAIETELIERWKNSPARDQEGREKLWMYLHIHRQLKENLTRIMEGGKLAELNLERDRTMRERLTAGFSSVRELFA